MARIAGALLVAATILTAAPSAGAATEHAGYLKTRDGTKLRYDLVRPDGPGRHPVLVNYEGYAAGSDASDNGVSTYTDRLLKKGYAILGVSVRGTGCSQGTFDPFAPTMGRDGYDAIEWAARQPWSNGRVGMIGTSFGGITQLVTAADRPPHLRAIAPDSATSDLYRDVAYPGGILEYDFTFAWTGIEKEASTTALMSRIRGRLGPGQYVLPAPGVTQGDTQCPGNYVRHEAASDTPAYFIPSLILSHPYYDDGGLWAQRAPAAGFKRIRVPVYLFNQWQDEQLPARIYDSLRLFGHPRNVWANFTNGNHGRPLYSPRDQNQILRFFDYFMRGKRNGFTARTPHLSIDMETAIQRKGVGNEPAWSITRKSLDARATPTPFYLRSGGLLAPAPPRDKTGSDSYRYPLPSSDVAEPGQSVPNNATSQTVWRIPPAPGGYLAYTSAPLKHDLVVAGPASLDLWLKSSATDTDLQATITEVRPDGQEEYVQRGWLRASHRKLDVKRSTALLPFHTDRRRDSTPLVGGKPTKLRLEIFPFAQAFRAGSRIRVWIDAPTSHTGFWAFESQPDAATNTILRDRRHRSRLVLGRLPREKARAPLPACDSLRNQPCRADPLAASD